MGKTIISFFGFIVAWGIYMYIIDNLLMMAQGLPLFP